MASATKKKTAIDWRERAIEWKSQTDYGITGCRDLELHFQIMFITQNDKQWRKNINCPVTINFITIMSIAVASLNQPLIN